jgi:AcrR family transcriptional regulator
MKRVMKMNKKADRILSKTIRLFIHKGIRKITIDAIAEYANVSKVTIYKYFQDKDTLYLETGRYMFSCYIKRLEEIAGREENIIKRLYDFMDIVSDFTDSGEFQLCGELTGYSAAIEKEYDMYLQVYRSSLRNLIDEGIRNGIFKNDVNRDIIFNYIDMGVVYYQQNAEYRNKMRSDSEFKGQFMNFSLGNIFIDGANILSPRGQL